MKPAPNSRLLAEIKSKDDNIRTLLEEPLRFPTSQRKAKSLFNFVGTISKKLFNIATLDDIHDLARHIFDSRIRIISIFRRTVRNH